VQLRIIKIDPQRHRLGLSLRQAEDAGDYGYEAWGGGGSYVLGGGSTATSTADGEEADEQEPAAEPEEPADTVHALSNDQPEPAAAEAAANGTARVPER
jgi:hypothetical protein